MKLYLCARVASDARPYSNLVAGLLRGWGHEVFVPHEQAYNQEAGHSPDQIFIQDHSAMRAADACVAVGRVGVDCSWEIGWFQGRAVPVFWVFHGLDAGSHPMLSSVRRVDDLNDLWAQLKLLAGEYVQEKDRPSVG